jgi:hypothetical protein
MTVETRGAGFKAQRSRCSGFVATAGGRYNEDLNIELTRAMNARKRRAMQEPDNPFSEAFGKAVDLGNRIADTDDKADIWDIADGLLAGAVQYWLYSRQPCSDPECEECQPISTAQGRIEELRKLMRQFAEESEYFHSPTDRNVGRA